MLLGSVMIILSPKALAVPGSWKVSLLLHLRPMGGNGLQLLVFEHASTPRLQGPLILSTPLQTIPSPKSLLQKSQAAMPSV